MTPDNAVELARQAIMAAIVLMGPVVLSGLVIGLLIGLVQALTQIQDQSVSFVPKLLGSMLILALTLHWLVQYFVNYTQSLFTNIPESMLGG
jgi:flagellar biosynthetic protein FliQ